MTIHEKEGNFIGTGKNGTSDLGNNGEGVDIRNSNNTVGGAASGAANVIAFNGLGVRVFGETTGNRILSNSIFSNDPNTDEGKRFIGESGKGSFTLKLKGAAKVPKGQAITTTATDPDGNTSEFSAEIQRA